MADFDFSKPIEQRHKDFAKAIVALAREHGFHNLVAEYYGGERWICAKTHWCEGRHGASNRINLRAEAVDHCDEDPHPALLETRECGNLLALCDRVPARTETKLAHRFLALTAVRLEAVRGMCWGEAPPPTGAE